MSNEQIEHALFLGKWLSSVFLCIFTENLTSLAILKKMIRYLIYMWVCCLLAACTQPNHDPREVIYVSISPLKSLVEAIVEDDFRVEVLVPSGASPETFEPSARQLVALNEAKWIFQIGLIDFETALLDRIGHDERIVPLHQGIELLAGSCSHHHHAHHHAHGTDPHIWTSPRALKRMAQTIFDTIHTTLPDSVRYVENHAQLQADLERLDQQTAAAIQASGIRRFVVYHPALTYYARDYGIHQLTIEQEGKEPSARQLSRLIREAREAGVEKILYQQQFPRSTVETIATDIGAEAVMFDPLATDVVANIEAITRIITNQ